MLWSNITTASATGIFIGVADFLPSLARTEVSLGEPLRGQRALALGCPWKVASDPTHTGWLERFSNEPRSNATPPERIERVLSTPALTVTRCGSRDWNTTKQQRPLSGDRGAWLPVRE